MAYELVCSLADVPEDEGLKVTVGALDLVIARDGGVRAQVLQREDLVAVALSEGEVADCQIECWLHGSRFDLRTGKPTGLPATEPVATFPIDVRGGDVYVDTETTLNGVTAS